MAEESLSTRLSFLVDIYGDKAVASRIKEMIHPVEKLQSGLNALLRDEKGHPLGKDIRKERLDQLSQMADRLDPKLKRFNMNWLSIMFVGMQVWRLFKGLFDSMIQTMEKLGGKFHPVNIAITRMAVSWEILKYTLMNALAPMILSLVDDFVGLVEWLQDLDPIWIERIAEAIALLGILGLAAFTFSQVMLFKDAVANIIKLASATGASAVILAIGAALAGIYFNKAEVWKGVLELIEDLKKLDIIGAIFDVAKIISAIGKGIAGGVLYLIGYLSSKFEKFFKAIQDSFVAAFTPGKSILDVWKKWWNDQETEAKNNSKEMSNYFRRGYNAGGGGYDNQKMMLWEVDSKTGAAQGLPKTLTFVQGQLGLITQEVKGTENGFAQVGTAVDGINQGVQATGNSITGLATGPVATLTGSIDMAGMTASELNSELSKDIHKTIYIHVVKTGSGTSSSTHGASGGGFSGSVGGQNQFAIGGGASVISSSRL